jgi:hypothetical protein
VRLRRDGGVAATGDSVLALDLDWNESIVSRNVYFLHIFPGVHRACHAIVMSFRNVLEGRRQLAPTEGISSVALSLR